MRIGSSCAALAFAIAIGVGFFSEEADARPALTVAIAVKPGNRVALKDALTRRLALRLRHDLGSGALGGYQIFLNRFADKGSWDGLVVLTFADDASYARWSAHQNDGGLDARTLALAEEIVSTPGEVVRETCPQSGSEKGSYLIVPYTALVSAPEYLTYLDQYTLPQFKGWSDEGVLSSYSVITSRFAAGRPWSSLILLRYRNDAALARRDEVVASVRRKLANDPAWKAVSDNKKAVRVEHALAVADLAASGGEP